MTQTVYDVLDELNSTAMSSAEKGSRFEKLIAAYLKADPTFAEQFSDVYLWQDWPGRGGRHDTGIDLVAVDRQSGLDVAIQCKFYGRESTISKPDIDSFLSASGKQGFAERIIFSTTDKWNLHAEETIKGQAIPVRRVGMAALEASPVDWGHFQLSSPDVLVLADRKVVRPHQQVAIDDVLAGFATRDRGKLIMACGTGKTFTALRLAEQLVGAGGSVLFLVPSIALMSQSLREWSTEADVPLAPVAICSDARVTRKKAADEDISSVDLALPATTNPERVRTRIADAREQQNRMTVVFCTYQSIDAVAQAQTPDGAGFDLVICDEAHRTTGVTLTGDDESAFVRVHDADYLRAAKRLYMTATPRIYDDNAKTKAGEANAVLASMDDEQLFGPEFHRLGFGDAVGAGLLTDYKVLVLAVDEVSVATTFQSQLSDENHELKLDDAAKIVGCWNGLAKRGLTEHTFRGDPQPMRRAVAFCSSIKDSERITRQFADIVQTFAAEVDGADQSGDPVLRCQTQHVDGTMNALLRNGKIDWLKADAGDSTCRILTNARCLSEGVDVPALDAVMFLNPRKSVVDVVQSVGRVMRRSPGKQYGYIILPIGIPVGEEPDQALRNHQKYQVVWEVLQALRAHDERFDAMVNKVELNSRRDDRINVIGVPGDYDGDGSADAAAQLALAFPQLDNWRDALYARMVTKVGSRRYWETWAADVAEIAKRHITRITALLDDPTTGVQAQFDEFLTGLRGNLNDGISAADAVEMLAQHLVSRPVFDALFAGYSFAEHNPVAQTMQTMLAVLDEHALDDENAKLERFYDSVRLRAKGIDNAEGRQRIVVELYDRFFSTAFKKTTDKLGIVYTPVEIVDFILNSADWALREHFGQGLTDEGVHILDGFAGTGTFMVRLLQSGLISPHDLARKYANELHANEILLLAYYIAAVNIETAYLDAAGTDGTSGYTPFEGLVLTDTFQSYEDGDVDDLLVFTDNNERISRQRKLPITVIVGNPPYSSGQDSANDNNANEKYPSLDAAIRDTYAARSTATLKNSLYDSYIRAIKWATLRIKDRGVVAFVTNGGFLDSITADGMRKTLAEEFSDIYLLNLKGNMRNSDWRREGGQIFGAGSQATVTVTMLVKDPANLGPATIHYTDVGDFLTRDEKLARVAESTRVAESRGVMGLESATIIIPNEHGDWLNQRRDDFKEFLPVGGKVRGSAVFRVFSGGLKTNRDAWCYNFQLAHVESNIRRHIHFFNSQVRGYTTWIGSHPGRTVEDFIETDPRQMSWDRVPRADVARGRQYGFKEESLRPAAYRPFARQHVYFNRQMNNTVYQLPRVFPTVATPNVGFYQVGAGSAVPFSVLMLDAIPDLHVTGAGSGGQFFPRWTYEAVNDGSLFAGGDGEVVDGYRRIDNITDGSLAQFRTAYGDSISKDDVFFYVYGLLHSPDYRETYAADLKKMLPRIPLVTEAKLFIDAGRQLSELHLGYESIEPFPLDGLDQPAAPNGDAAYGFYRVEKMRFGKPTPEQKAAGERHDRSTVVYNSHLTLRGIPEDAYRYLLGSRSAVEWIIDRYQIQNDKPSGIVNDPNDWSREVQNPRYIIDLLARIVTVSLETMTIVDALAAGQA